ncbi:MAG: adenylosuccinate lyase [Anaerolineae bacterium]
MLDRYTRPQMKAIWSLENTYRKWLEVELAVCEVQAEMGQIPPEAMEAIRKKAAFSAERIAQIEAEVHHDLIAFLTDVSERIGEAGRYLHRGLTSSDVKDTALALQMREAMEIIIEGAKECLATLKEQALKHRHTVMVGRTHGVHAEPITLGLKFALWAFEMKRNLERLTKAQEVISYGKLSGAVGTYAHLEPEVEERVCRKLGLKPAPISSQILQRDRHAEYIWALAITAASIEKFASEIRALQRTEILEVEEPFRAGQKGSSAMPHKRNPILCERLCGQARLLRGYLIAALEDVPLWGERDMSHSSVERVILPDATSLLDYMLARFTGVLKNLQVYPERMRRNLALTQGLIASEGVLLALMDKGLSREEAYCLVQSKAMAAWQGKGDFKTLLAADAEIRPHLSEEELEALFDMDYYLRHLDAVFARLEEL